MSVKVIFLLIQINLIGTVVHYTYVAIVIRNM